MTTPAHAAIGYLISQSLLEVGFIPSGLSGQAVSLGILSALAPDIDALRIWRLHTHRANSVFHKPLLWAVSYVPMLVYQYFFGNPGDLWLWVMAGLGILSHFVCDSLDYSTGISWLWPYRKDRISFSPYTIPDPAHLREFPAYYRRNPSLILEVIIISIAVLWFLSRNPG